MSEMLQRSSRSGKVLAIYAALLLLGCMALPWWRMECRAPQYGLRVLVISVSPMDVSGDIKEIDGLGHYVGLRGVDTFAPVERRAAPIAMTIGILAALVLPFLRPGRVRALAAAAVMVVPVAFLFDLWVWQRYATTHLDPHAALNLIANRVQARLLGEYKVAQFSVRATLQSGFWLSAVAAANALGFLIAERRRVAERSPAGRPLTAAVVGVLVLLAFGRTASAATLEVGANQPYATVSAAIANAAAGDTIRVRKGVYREHLQIQKPLTLEGDRDAILDGGGADTILSIETGGVRVDGFTIRSSGTSLLGEDAGVRITKASGCTVANTRIEDTLFGILVNNSPGVHLVGNYIRGKDLPIPFRGDGIRLNASGDSLVQKNVIERSRDLSIWQSNHVDVIGNVVRGSRYGLHYMYCDDDRFEDNVFEGNQVGGAIMYSRRLTLRNNSFSGSRGPSAYGLLLKVADDVIVENNRFVDNTHGLYLEEAPQARGATCTFRSNLIGGNDVGVALEPSVAGSVFTENALVSNRVQVQLLGSRRSRADANAWRGNYWSDYVGFDQNGDGIGDTPYRVEQYFEDLAGRYPSAGLLRMGPAAEALELAARAFPIVKPQPAAVDEHPLLRAPALSAGAARPRRTPLLLVGGLCVMAAAAYTVRRVGGEA
jgi:nitrous oxidase accessory protein